jgi:hypothetical protein
MDIVLIATAVLAVLGVVAGAAGIESRDGFVNDDGRPLDR